MTFCPFARALLIAWTPSDGFAMKKLEIGSECPGVWPFAQVVPEPFVCASGTNTLQLSLASTVKNGFSREVGFEASVVYGGLGKPCAGAFVTPAKTWFQTPFVQPSMSLLRVSHCCCEPLRIVLLLNCESAMKPPLAYDGPV